MNNYVESLFEDKEGNIWIGTQKGFSKFNGLTFQNFHIPKNDFITAISQEPLGKIWIGTTKGTFQFDGKKFTNFYLPSSRVNHFFYDKKDNLWIDKNLLFFLMKFITSIFLITSPLILIRSLKSFK